MARPNRRDEALKHLERGFPITCRVVMTDKAAQQWPKYKGIRGTVVAYENGISPKVLWDGRKTANGYHPGFLKRVKQ